MSSRHFAMMAYLIAAKKMSPYDALVLIQNARAFCSPNTAFLGALVLFHVFFYFVSNLRLVA
jgi:hypothetical protein